MAHSQRSIFANSEISSLIHFCKSIPDPAQTLVVIGGGTAALAYLYTADIESQYRHIIILGERGLGGGSLSLRAAFSSVRFTA